MKLEIPEKYVLMLHKELTQAKEKEIGGILMGEQLAPGKFKVINMTFQKSGGTVASFIRNAKLALDALKNFFNFTSNNYSRFNYLGEWHSHPSFIAIPSRKDHQTMIDMVIDPTLNATFTVLLIVKLSGTNSIESSLTTYLPDGSYTTGQVIFQKDTLKD